MKQLFVFSLLLCSASAFAQDVIVKQDGSTILSKVIEIGTEEVKYKKFSNPDGPTYNIRKADIMTINYENGEKETFENQSSQPANEEPSPKDFAPGGLTGVLKSANESIIAQYNAVTPVWNSPQSMKKAKHILNIFKVDESSIFENNDVKQTFAIGRAYWTKDHWGDLIDSNDKIAYMQQNYVLTVKIYNKTNKTMYIDLANTFITRGDEAQPYYVPTATTTTHGTTTATSVNVGAVAGALGIGGGLGTLAKGVNVGSGSSSSSTTIEYSQRVVAIPPQSAKSLEPQFLFVGGGKGMPLTSVTDRSDNKYWMIYASTQYKGLQVGDVIHWRKDDPSIKVSFRLSYAFDESCSSQNMMSVGFYSSETYGVKTKMKASTTDYVVEDLEGWQNVPFKVFMRNDPDEGIDVSQLNVERTGK